MAVSNTSIHSVNVFFDTPIISKDRADCLGGDAFNIITYIVLGDGKPGSGARSASLHHGRHGSGIKENGKICRYRHIPRRRRHKGRDHIGRDLAEQRVDTQRGAGRHIGCAAKHERGECGINILTCNGI